MIKTKVHFEMSGEIRRELVNSVCRGEVVPENEMMENLDQIMEE